jgi:adenylate cyclase
LNSATEFQLSDFNNALQAAEALAQEAFARDSTDSDTRALLSYIYRIRGEFALAVAEAESALALSPNSAYAQRQRGCALIFSGDRAAGIQAVEASLRLEPSAHGTAGRLNWITLGLYLSGEYAASADAARRVIRLTPTLPHSYRWLAVALGQLGRALEAKEALDTAIKIAPASFDMYVRNRVPWMRPEDHAHMLDGLRKAGWEG